MLRHFCVPGYKRRAVGACGQTILRATSVLACAGMSRGAFPWRSPPPSPLSGEQAREAARATIADYAARAAGYAAASLDHDVSQNIEAFLSPLSGTPAPLDILDVCCAGGRDLLAFTKMGHRAVGIDGVEEFCDISRLHSGCEVWQQDLTALDLPEGRFDGIFCNACLFHVPSAALPETLRRLTASLRPGGVLFVSNAHGFGEDKEGWSGGRTPTTNSWVCWLSEESWVERCEDAGLVLLDKFYRPPGKPRSQQPFLATVWKKVFVFAHRTHFSHMSHPTFPISHLLFYFSPPCGKSRPRIKSGRGGEWLRRRVVRGGEREGVNEASWALVRRAAVHRAAVHRAAVHRAAVHRVAVHRAAVHRAASAVRCLQRSCTK